MALTSSDFLAYYTGPGAKKQYISYPISPQIYRVIFVKNAQWDFPAAGVRFRFRRLQAGGFVIQYKKGFGRGAAR